MRKLHLIVFAGVLFFAGGALFGHAPDRIKVQFDTQKNTLTIEVRHAVKNSENHFVNKIIVRLEGEKIIEQKNIRQEEKTGQEIRYIIPGAKAGDEIKIKAECSVYGSREKAIKIRKK